MTELDELTFGKSHEELNMELLFQLEQGETLGGTICSHIVHQLNHIISHFSFRIRRMIGIT